MMQDEILTNLVEDFLKDKISTMIFVKYYRDIFGFLVNEDEITPYIFKHLKELHEYLEHYNFVSGRIDEYYHLDDNDVKIETSKIYRLINN